MGSETRWEFIFSDEESFPLKRWAVWFCVLSSYLIIPNFYTSRRPIRAQLLDPLYKFIVMSPLGLDLIRRWAQPENCNLTIGAICGESCLCDDECNGLLRQDQVP